MPWALASLRALRADTSVLWPIAVCLLNVTSVSTACGNYKNINMLGGGEICLHVALPHLSVSKRVWLCLLLKKIYKVRFVFLFWFMWKNSRVGYFFLVRIWNITFPRKACVSQIFIYLTCCQRKCFDIHLGIPTYTSAHIINWLLTRHSFFHLICKCIKSSSDPQCTACPVHFNTVCKIPLCISIMLQCYTLLL